MRAACVAHVPKTHHIYEYVNINFRIRENINEKEKKNHQTSFRVGGDGVRRDLEVDSSEEYDCWHSPVWILSMCLHAKRIWYMEEL